MSRPSDPLVRILATLVMALATAVFATRPTDARQLPSVTVHVVDVQGLAVPGATCSLVRTVGSTAPDTVVTDERGNAVFGGVGAGSYTLRVELQGFEPFVRTRLVVDSARLETVEAILTLGAVTQRVSVAAPTTTEATVRAGSTPAQGAMGRRVLQRLPLATAAVRDALPLVPGVMRSSTGELTFNGSAEAHSGLSVNGMNAVDPATGDFRLSLPVDAVEGVQVFLHPYTAEYGQFTGGITRVDTRPGGDRWRFELNDFLPDFRFVGGRIRGIAEDVPHLNVSGPLFGKRLFLSQSASYTIAKRPVRGLEFPNNETRTEGQSYFTQLDINERPGVSQTLTLGYAPERRDSIGLDVFRPQTATPSARRRDMVVTGRDSRVMRGGLLRSSISVSRFDTSVWGRGDAELTLTPTVEAGNYFATQNRRSMRVEWLEVFSLQTRHWLGTHDIQLGLDGNRVSLRLDYRARPVNIVREDGTLSERIVFHRLAAIAAANREYVGFVQDRWMLGDRLALDLGLRYEDQRIADATLVAPRAGFAWSPSVDGNTLLRGGVGLFFDKVPLNIRSFAHYPSRTVTRFGADGVTVLDRRRFTNVLVDASEMIANKGGPQAQTEFVPENVTWSLQVERTVHPWLALRANAVHSQTANLYIVDPLMRADGSSVIALSSTGRSAYYAEEIAARLGRADRVLTISYTHSRARGDLNDFAGAFGDFAAPLIRANRYSQLATDAPHRLLAWGSITLPRRVSLAPIVEVRTGFPFTVRDAVQEVVGTPNADATRFPRFIALDLEATKELQITKKYAVRLSLRGFNLTNHFNPRDVRANVADPGFGGFLAPYRRYFTAGFDIVF